mgnify:CR=1 FL=1
MLKRLNHIAIVVPDVKKAKEIYNYRNKMEFTFSNNPWFEKYNPKIKKELRPRRISTLWFCIFR